MNIQKGQTLLYKLPTALSLRFYRPGTILMVR